jgi:uncharacterized protein YeaO (DUF488 family)
MAILTLLVKASNLHRYFIELKDDPDAWRPIVEAARHGTVTLIYSSHDTAHNNALALQEFLKVHQPRLR